MLAIKESDKLKQLRSEILKRLMLILSYISWKILPILLFNDYMFFLCYKIGSKMVLNNGKSHNM